MIPKTGSGNYRVLAQMVLDRRSNKGGSAIILRVFQVVTRAGKENEFNEFFRETAIPLMINTPGIVSVLPGAPRPESPREFSFVMVWKDLESLQAFVGEDYQNPHIDPAESELVESRSIKHYDLVEVN